MENNKYMEDVNLETVQDTSIQDAMSALDSLLSTTDLKHVSAESTGDRENLPDGYYLCEVENAKFTVSKSSGNPMVAFTFKVVENGTGVELDEHGYTQNVELAHTANRKTWVYYVFKDEKSIKRFASDMLKFEDDPGVPVLSEEYYTNGAEILIGALEILIGKRIYLQVSTSEKNGEKQTWQNLISWKRAIALNLPQ